MLGMEAQKQIIDFFVEREGGELIADYEEVYTGTELSGCKELQKAIQHCKEEGAILIIAKSDRFRETREALEIYDEMGDGNIYFCDLPRSDKFTLTLFFSLAEREAMLVSIRTKQALNAKKERGEQTGGTKELWGSKSGKDDNYRAQVIKKASDCASKKRREEAKNNHNNRVFWEFLEDWQEAHGKIAANTDWTPIVAKLVARGRKTTTGLEFTKARARALYYSLKRVYND